MTGKPKDPDKQHSPNWGGKRIAAPGKTLGRDKSLANPVRVTFWIEADELEQIKKHGSVTDVLRRLVKEFLEQ